MKPFERALVSVAAVIVILWFGWQIAVQAVVTNIRLANALQACEAKVAPPSPPK